MKNSKEKVISSVQNSVSSIFSKEDVINLINSVEAGGRTITVTDIECVIDTVMNYLENEVDNLVDKDSCEFEISYNNQLQVTDIPVDFLFLRDTLEEHFMDLGEAEVDEEQQTGYVESECN
jgi:hypothetical protein